MDEINEAQETTTEESPQARPAETHEETPKKSAIWKLQAVLLEPANAFAALRQHPTWLVALFLATVFIAGKQFILLQTLGAEEYTIQAVEIRGQDPADIPDAQWDLTVTITQYSAFLQWLIVVPIICLIVAGVCLACFLLTGGEPTFRRFLSVVCHCFAVIALVELILVGLVAAVSDPENILIVNPVATNLGFLFDPKEQPAFFALGAAIDLPTLYKMFLMATGFAIVANARTRGGAFTIVFGLYALLSLIGAGIAAAFAG